MTQDHRRGGPQGCRRGGQAGSPARRFDFDPDDVGRGLGELVIAIVEILRQLLERQAVRRFDAGMLSDDEAEQVGRALMALESAVQRLAEHFSPGQPRPFVDQEEPSWP